MTDLIQTEDALDEVLTRPRPVLVEFIRQVSSPLVILGAGGKMGATLARLARRAAEAARCELELVALKFGTAQNPSLTWAVNTLAPAHAVERYASARVVALSTGNVYPYVPVGCGGATEDHPLTPMGEYANAAVARERLFEYASRRNGTRIVLLRLIYAVELRYGVLVDIARKVWAGEPVNVANGCFNCIWQGDANEMILRALNLASSPPAAFNLTCPAAVSVREVAGRFSELLGRPAKFIGAESDTALLGNAGKLGAELGPPATPLEDILDWTAQWVKSGGRYWNKPTHFEVRDGQY